MTDDAANALQAGYAYSPGDSPADWNFGTYWRLPATSHTTKGRSTTAITEPGTPAPQVVMPSPGTSAIELWRQIAAGRSAAPWQGQAHRRVDVVTGGSPRRRAGARSSRPQLEPGR